ncbi:FAD-dependent monooxygenase [Amycolatopsis pithecellobii]|uniref:FAD-dependent oxidoreductase n=1 Tax=Amycolatopsis pithecellobii TaxID=664692 RepID=A0A6N7YZC6_9PSEU|nr:FAD-dependent monooxygenase [Amycolatopsis pithecellobii]MTD52424.1 FAD-dependent oxidoreductase [Amycolatopsis pithecellobii]
MQDSVSTKARTILISGAGPAGQALAYWLQRHGFAPTVVESADHPRRGGYAIDLRGAAVTVAERMEIIEELREARIHMKEVTNIDHRGDVIWKTDGNFGAGSGDVEIARDDLSTIMMKAIPEGVEYLFGNSITAIRDGDTGVDVTFLHGPERRFDLLIGCDGLHSNVRSLAFGAEEQFTKWLGFYTAIFTIPNMLDLDGQMLMCSTPGALSSMLQYGQGKETRANFIFSSARQHYDPADRNTQMDLIERAMGHETSWHIPDLLNAMRETDDFYFDEVTQIHMSEWGKGRVALCGDAAYAPTLISGQGTSLAVVGAYILAGELLAADGDHHVAFARYQQRMRPWVKQNQQLALDPVEWEMPNTWEELEQRNEFLRNRAESDGEDYGTKTQKAAGGITLEHYGSA